MQLLNAEEMRRAIARLAMQAVELNKGTEFVLMKERVEGTPDPAEWIASRLSGATSTEVGIDGMSSSAATVEALIADLRKAGGITVRTNLDVLEEITLSVSTIDAK